MTNTYQTKTTRAGSGRATTTTAGKQGGDVVASSEPFEDGLAVWALPDSVTVAMADLAETTDVASPHEHGTHDPQGKSEEAVDGQGPLRPGPGGGHGRGCAFRFGHPSGGEPTFGRGLGHFRSETNAKAFMTVRSYLQTGAKHGHNALDLLTLLWTTGAWLPTAVNPATG